MNFIKSNFIFLIWLLFYALILAVIYYYDVQVFYVLLIAELASLILAFSPIGEWLLRVMSGARRIKTKKDSEYLMPLFNAVYEDARGYNRHLSRRIKLYIEEDKDVNAFAFGTNSISVTRGAIESLDEDSLKGVIAHEFGHISNGDTKATLVMTIGNGAFVLVWLFFKFFLTRGKHKDDLQLIFLLNAIIAFLVTALIAIGNRRSEYMADKFAYDIGHGEGLLETLYFFKEMSMGGRMKLRERLRSSHPNTDNRIKRLEKLDYVPPVPTPRQSRASNKPKIEVIRQPKVKTVNQEIIYTQEEMQAQLADTQLIDITILEARLRKYNVYFDNSKNTVNSETENDVLSNISRKVREAQQLKEREKFWKTTVNSDVFENI